MKKVIALLLILCAGCADIQQRRGAVIIADNTLRPLLTWNDRRPIVSLHVCSTSWRSPTNPHGWLWDTRDFRAGMIAYIDRAIAVMKEIGAQGGVVWDIEGLTATGEYIGAPDLANSITKDFTPALRAEFFSRFRAAGFKVGVCIRAQEYDPALDIHRQQGIPFLVLMRKAAFARQAWKCTLFYIDSNNWVHPERPNGWADGPLMPAATFARLRKAIPDALWIPEHCDRGSYHLYTSPYFELRMGYTGTPDYILADNPTAFSVINVGAGDTKGKMDILRASFRRGDILMIDAWWRNPQIDDVIQITRPALLQNYQWN